uniref:Restriction modification system DNA specificity domain protein n=1 Tax=Cyanothece sp. (strain PCC 7425 / ATCC 29141) TaxID=395961 RepID=B8HLU3_CYAP4
MKLETFFENFGLLTDALNAVAKLREIVLQLAVRGKLVSQNSSDEPAEALLQRVKAEKEQLVLDRVIVRDVELPAIQDQEMLFSPAGGWQWERLGNLARFIDYRGKTPLKTDSGIKLITAKNVRMGFLQDEPKEYISEQTYYEWMTRGFPRRGDILFTTEAPLGNVAQLLIDERIALAQRIIDLQPFADLYARYLLTALTSPLMQRLLNEKATGMTAQGIKSVKLKLIPMPIPPLAEQKRIVEKCDRLLILCDEIEKRQQQRQESLLKMNEGAIFQLLTAQNPDDFYYHWQAICNNFDLLYSIPETIPKLRQAILQLAVQGKLVQQSFDEKSLKDLVGQIQEERFALNPSEKDQKRIREEFNGIIYKFQQGNIKTLEMPAICFCNFITKGTTPASNELLPEGDIPYLKVYNIVNNRIDFFYKPSYISNIVHTTKLKRSIVFPGDILMNIVGPPLGKVAIVPDDFLEWNINQALAVFRPVNSVYNKFLYYALSSFATLENVLGETKGTAGQDNLSLEQCRSLRVPLYDLAEQKRIVAKVDALLSLCDALEDKLKAARDSSTTLMEVAARQILVA